jgi:hypothetical protein
MELLHLSFWQKVWTKTTSKAFKSSNKSKKLEHQKWELTKKPSLS